MPQFNKHTPKSQGDMKAIRENNRVQSLPTGIIAESLGYAYGYDGDTYYVTEGSFYHLVTRMSLSQDEARQLFNVLDFEQLIEPHPKTISRVIKSARRLKLSNDELFWYLQQEL